MVESILKSAQDQFDIGFCYERGRTIPRSHEYAKAFHYYQFAAHQGHSQAQASLAFLYAWGLGTQQDDQQAFHYAQLAFKQKDPFGTALLGKLYEEGKGTGRSFPQAAYCYQTAANQGNVVALD